MSPIPMMPMDIRSIVTICMVDVRYAFTLSNLERDKVKVKTATQGGFGETCIPQRSTSQSRKHWHVIPLLSDRAAGLSRVQEPECQQGDVGIEEKLETFEKGRRLGVKSWQRRNPQSQFCVLAIFALPALQ